MCFIQLLRFKSLKIKIKDIWNTIIWKNLVSCTMYCKSFEIILCQLLYSHSVKSTTVTSADLKMSIIVCLQSINTSETSCRKTSVSCWLCLIGGFRQQWFGKQTNQMKLRACVNHRSSRGRLHSVCLPCFVYVYCPLCAFHNAPCEHSVFSLEIACLCMVVSALRYYSTCFLCWSLAISTSR